MHLRQSICLMLATVSLAHCGCLIEPSQRGGLPVVERMRDGLNRQVRWSEEMPYGQDEQMAFYEEPTQSRFKAVPTRDVFAANPAYSATMSAPGPIQEDQPEVFVPGKVVDPDNNAPQQETLPPPNNDSNPMDSDPVDPANGNPNSVLTRLNPPAQNSWPGIREAQNEADDNLPGWRPLRR